MFETYLHLFIARPQLSGSCFSPNSVSFQVWLLIGIPSVVNSPSGPVRAHLMDGLPNYDFMHKLTGRHDMSIIRTTLRWLKLLWDEVSAKNLRDVLNSLFLSYPPQKNLVLILRGLSCLFVCYKLMKSATWASNNIRENSIIGKGESQGHGVILGKTNE